MEVHNNSGLDAVIQGRLGDQAKMARLEEPAKMARLEDQAKTAQAAPSVGGGHDPTDMGAEVVCTRMGGFFNRNYKCTRIWKKGACKFRDGRVSCSPPDVQDFAGFCQLIKGNVFCSRISPAHCETVDGRTKCSPPTTQQWLYKCDSGTCRLIPLVTKVKGNIERLEDKAAASGDVIQGKIGTNDQAEKAMQGILSKRADGYCTEGTICGSPVYGRPLWIWVLAVFVILLGLKAIDDS
jgi:hypothetical protein